MAPESPTIIDGDNLGLTEEDILKEIKQLEGLQTVLSENLNPDNKHSVLDLEGVTQSLALLNSQEPEKTLQEVENIFLFVQRSTSEGIDLHQIARKLFEYLTLVSITTYIPLLKKVP